MSPKKLKCPYCNKGGFPAQGPLKSHIKALHANQAKEDKAQNDEFYDITYRVQKVPTPGFQLIHCPACQQPRQAYIKDDGTIASSDDDDIPAPVPSSLKGGRTLPKKRNAHPIVIKERYKMRWNKERGRWKNTVAMMGTHGKTAPEMPWHELGIAERWLLNDSHGITYVKPHVEAGRVTRWWQIHHRWRITRRATRNATDHWQWLQDVKTVPRIHMQRKFREIPASEETDIRQYCEEFIAGRLGRGAGYVQQYFTNTFSYMFAQVLLEKVKGIYDWERIELYGCELEQLETEYFRQRPGIEFWAGILVAHGIELYTPQSCFMFYSQDIQVNQFGQQQMLQYPGYMAYGFKSPSLEEAKAGNLPIGVDPIEENIIGSWDDYEYQDFTYAMNEHSAVFQQTMDLSNFPLENDAINEWIEEFDSDVTSQ